MATVGTTTQSLTSKRSRDEANRDVEMFVMANCSKLLSSRAALQTDTEASSSSSRVFECKTCDRKFDSFQALGGHRASHKRPKLGLDLSMTMSGAADLMRPSKMYECSICGLEFPIGQALGGHMRRHQKEGLSLSVLEKKRVAEVAVPAVVNEADGTVDLCLDLNLTPFENRVNNSGENLNNKFTTRPLYTHEFLF